jgi:hypothetical protein
MAQENSLSKINFATDLLAARQNNLDARVQHSLAKTAQTDPDALAETLRLSKQTGLPTDYIERNKDAVKKQQALSAVDFSDFERNNPELKGWLANPDNMGLITGDYGIIGGMKKVFSDIPEAGARSADMVQLIELGEKEMAGIATPEELARAREITARRDKPLGTGGFVSDAVLGVVDTSAPLANLALEIQKTGLATGLATGAATAVLMPPASPITAPIAAGMGYTAGSVYGGLNYGYKWNRASTYYDLLKIEDENGNKIDPETARFAATIVGAVSAPLEYAGFSKILSTVPGADQLKKMLTREGIKQLIKQPGMRAALKTAGGKLVEAAGTEGLTEAGQGAAQIIAEEWIKSQANADRGTNFDQRSFGQATGDVAYQGALGAAIGGIYSAPGTAVQVGIEVRNQRYTRPEDVAAKITEINQAVRDNKLFQRSPDAFHSMIEHLTGDERFYIDSQAATQMISQLDAAQQGALFNAIPALKVELETALKADGGDISIRKADYATYIAPYQQADMLRDHIKLDPADLSVAERAQNSAFLRENPNIMQEIGDIVDGQLPISAQEIIPSIERVVRKSLQDAGRGYAEASNLAPLYANTGARFAVALGDKGITAINQGLLQFQSEGQDGQPIMGKDGKPLVGSNFKVLLSDLKALNEGKTVRGLDDVGRQAVIDFGQRLERAGITGEQAQTMSADEILAQLYPQTQMPEIAPESVNAVLDQQFEFPGLNLEGSARQALEAIGLSSEAVVGMSAEQIQSYVQASNEAAQAQADQVRKLYQLDGDNNFDEAAANELSQKAIDLMGITKEPLEAGFVLRDGTMLDLSGRNQAAGYVRAGESFVPVAGKPDYLKAQRAVDHREISVITSAQGYDGLLEFLTKSGAVRVDFNSGLVNANIAPTPQQVSRIVSAAKKTGLDNLNVEYTDLKGNIVSQAFLSTINGKNITRVFNEKLFRDELFQRERGSISFNPVDQADFEGRLRKVVTAFTERSNFSTGAHEFSHWAVATHRYFADLARQQIAAGNNNFELQRIIDDWEGLKKKVGATSDVFTVKQEEKIANLYELYMREGRAPSESLVRVFARYRDWLMRICQDIKALGVELDDETRGIFDRWLASEQEIDQVKNKNGSLAATARNLGLPDDITAQVANYLNGATIEAEQKLYRELTKENKARQTQEYKDRLQAAIKKQRAEIINTPLYRLISDFMRDGNKIYVGNAKPEDLGIAPDLEFAPPEAIPIEQIDIDIMRDEAEQSDLRRQSIVNILLAPVPKEPQSLLGFLRSKGGIREDAGELKSRDLKKTMRGLVREDGLTLDDALVVATEAGFFAQQDDNNPVQNDINTLLAAIDSELQGQKYYKADDINQAMQYQAHMDLVAEADQIANEMSIDLEKERLLRKNWGRYGYLITIDENTLGAIPADVAAETYGYTTGDEMLKALRQAKDIDYLARKQGKEALQRDYPDSMVNGQLKIKALPAVINDRVLLALDLMIKELSKQFGSTPVSMKQFAKIMAQSQVAKMRMAEVNYVFRYEVAREKELRMALQKSRAGKPQEAMLHLQRAMLNQAIYKSLQNFKDVREKAEDLFRRVDAKDKTLAGGSDIDVVGAARYVLHKFGLGGENFNIEKWIDALEESDPQVAQDLVKLTQIIKTDAKPAKELSVAEYMDIYNAVREIMHVARRVREFQIGEKRVQRETALGELKESLAQKAQAPVIEGTQVYGLNKMRKNLLSINAAKSRVEHWTNVQDRGYGGPFRTYFWNPITKASISYRESRTHWFQRLAHIFSEHKEYLQQKGKISAPELIKNQNGQAVRMVFRDRMELIGFLLHTGNESNLDKLLGGYGINQSTFWDAIRALENDGRITEQDWKIVRSLWGLAEDLKPISQKAHKDLYGYRFEEVESQPVQTRWGAIEGGYWPAVVDYDQVDSKNIERALQESKQFMVAATNKGFTKSRVTGYKKPLSTDLRLATNHIDQVLRFAYLEPAVRQVSSLVNDQGFKDALKAVDSEAYGQMLMPWLQRVAQQLISEPSPAGQSGISLRNRAARWLRTTSSAQAMMGNLSNALQNLTGFSVSIYKVGPVNFAQAFVRHNLNPLASAREVRQLSQFMRVRQNVLDSELMMEINDLIGRKGALTKTKNFAMKHGYIFQRLFQNYVDNITWQAAYSQWIEKGNSDAEAILYADSIVRTTQGSLTPEDISALEAGSEGAKLFLMFYSHFNNQDNLIGSETKNIISEFGWSGAPRLFYLYMMTVAIPAIAAEMIIKYLRDDLPDDEDEDGQILDDYLAWMSGAQFRYAAATVPYLGQVGNWMMNLGNDKPFDDRMTVSPVLSYAEGAGKFIARELQGENENDGRRVRSALTTLGFITGLPLGQLGKPAGYLADIEAGRVDPENAGDVVRGLIAGTPPQK